MFPRFGIRVLLLLVTCVAIWAAYVSAKRSIKSDLSEIRNLNQLAPELQIRGKDEFAVLEIARAGHIKEFHCYLPPDRTYSLNLKWQGGFSKSAPKNADFSLSLPSGSYRIQLDVGELIRLIVDDSVVVEQPNPYFQNVSAYLNQQIAATPGNRWVHVSRPLVLHGQQRGLAGQMAEAGIVLWSEVEAVQPIVSDPE